MVVVIEQGNYTSQDLAGELINLAEGINDEFGTFLYALVSIHFVNLRLIQRATLLKDIAVIMDLSLVSEYSRVIEEYAHLKGDGQSHFYRCWTWRPYLH